MFHLQGLQHGVAWSPLTGRGSPWFLAVQSPRGVCCQPHLSPLPGDSALSGSPLPLAGTEWSLGNSFRWSHLQFPPCPSCQLQQLCLSQQPWPRPQSEGAQDVLGLVLQRWVSGRRAGCWRQGRGRRRLLAGSRPGSSFTRLLLTVSKGSSFHSTVALLQTSLHQAPKASAQLLPPNKPPLVPPSLPNAFPVEGRLQLSAALPCITRNRAPCLFLAARLPSGASSPCAPSRRAGASSSGRFLSRASASFALAA